MKTSPHLDLAIMMAFGGLLAVMAFVGVEALVIKALMHEEYLRYASAHLPGGGSVAWQTYRAYPIHWGAVRHTLAAGWLALPGIALAVLYTGRLWVLTIERVRSGPRVRTLSAKILHSAGGLVLAVVTFDLASKFRNEWLGGLPVRECGYVAAMTFLLLPLWLMWMGRGSGGERRVSQGGI